MSDTPRTDALDAKYTAMLDKLISAPQDMSTVSVVDAAKIMIVGYGKLCKKVEGELAVCRAVTALCCEKKSSARTEATPITEHQLDRIEARLFGPGEGQSTNTNTTYCHVCGNNIEYGHMENCVWAKIKALLSNPETKR